MSQDDANEPVSPTDTPPPVDAPPPEAPSVPQVTLPVSDPGPPISSRDGIGMPHSIEAEREVLGAALVDPSAMDVIIEHVEQVDFYIERYALVYEAMRRTYEAHNTFDTVMLQEDMTTHGTWEKSGAIGTLNDLVDRAGTVANLEHYCEIVRRRAMIRRMVNACRSIESEGLQEIDDTSSYLDRAEQAVFAVLEEKERTSLRALREVVASTIEQITVAYDSEGSVTGVGTGYRELDRLTHGLQPGDLIIIAARPAMGKTSFCLNLAANAALKHQATVAVFSLEMPSEQLAARMLAAEARIDVSRLRGGDLTEEDWPRLTRAADDLSSAQVFIDDTPGITPSAIRAKCRRLKRKNDLKLVIIDYLQLMNSGGYGKSREQEISYVSRTLKELAKEISVPVIALSQLNRSLESRTDKRPMMSDLRESGAIEQDADLIGFIYREEVYNKEIDESQRGIAELIIAKHRNGPTDTVKLKFWKQWTRFDNLMD